VAPPVYRNFHCEARRFTKIGLTRHTIHANPTIRHLAYDAPLSWGSAWIVSKQDQDFARRLGPEFTHGQVSHGNDLFEVLVVG
jgi:hypothetical protein